MDWSNKVRNAGHFCHIADTKGHGVMTDKALPALVADADKVGSESVELWFRLASAAAKRNLRDSYPKTSTEKDTVSLLREKRRCGIEPEMTVWV